MGLAAMGGGVHRLVRQLPDKMAMGFLLTGRQFSAQEALAFGLENEVVPGEMRACAPLALRATKQVAPRRNLDYASLANAIRADYPAAERMLESEDAEEGGRGRLLRSGLLCSEVVDQGISISGCGESTDDQEERLFIHGGSRRTPLFLSMKGRYGPRRVRKRVPCG